MATFGTNPLFNTDRTKTDMFLAKYDGQGQAIWARRIGAYDPNSDCGRGGLIAGTSLAVGQSGALYTCGIIMSKYDSAGNILWSKPFALAQSMVVDSAENIYATGSGNGTYGDLTVTNVNGVPDFFVARCDSNGNLVWSRQLGSTKQQTVTSLGLDDFGNVYIGSISATANREPVWSVGNTTLTNVMTLLVKYSAGGDSLWARALGGANRAQP